MEDLEQPTIIEHREELMVSLSGGTPTLRPAHFLKPSVSAIEDPIFELQNPSLNLSDLPLKVAFKGSRDPLRKWEDWVDRMKSLHQLTWKKAGIFEAIITSTYQIRIDTDIVLGLGSRFCSETNTFVFPWGEATVTLEDVVVLGGYSVLGDSVLGTVEIEELGEIDEKLLRVRTEITRSKSRKADQHQWTKRFMNSGSEIEHEAFLVLWLSRHVFPNSFNNVGKHVHHIAIRLARGIKIALAPAVLSRIYRDLRLLKEAIVGSMISRRINEDGDELGLIDLWAPMHLVQIWGWERFPSLRPIPNLIEHGEPRMARWNKAKRAGIENVGSVIDSSGDSFQWRPFAISEKSWLLYEFYKEREEWVSCTEMDEDLESFARFLRACELVGLDCIEQYLPHRVAMQFGMDQDLPGRVARFNETPEIAWENYTRPIGDAKLYVPSRLFESDVTTRYLKWWIRSNFVQEKNLRKKSHSSKGKKVDNDAPKTKRIKAAKSIGKDEHILQSSQCTKPQTPSPLIADNGDGKEMESQVETGEHTRSNEAVMGESCQFTENVIESRAGIQIDNGVSINNNEGEIDIDDIPGFPVSELEARISRLENFFAQLKAARARR